MRKYCIAILISLSAYLWPVTSHAIITFIDQFTITRDGTTVLNDTFADNVPPPSGPAGASTYNVLGTIPGTAESGGLLELNTATGAFSANAIETPRLSVVVTRLTGIAGEPSQLGSGNLLSETGLFNLTIPTGPLFSAYGIRFSDNVGARNGDGQLVQLFVRFNPATGQAEIVYILQDFGNNTITPLGVTPLSPPAGADQILFTLFQNQVGGAFFGSYQFVDGGVPQGSPTTFALGGQLFTEVNYVRGQFFAAQGVGVPEPGSLMLLGSGLFGLGLITRRKTWRKTR